MLSYWEKETFINYDVIIVGAGITGLSSAISILEKKPSLKVLILEKSIFPSGASTKNAGFACFGSLTELLSDIEVMGEPESLSLVEKRWSGLQKLRTRFTDEELGYEPLGGFELLRESQLGDLSKIDQVNQFLFPLFQTKVFTDVSDKVGSFGFKNTSFSGMLLNQFEGQIHTGKTLDSLWKRAGKLGAKILTGANVTLIEHNVLTVSSTENNNIEFTGEKIVVATNAFSKVLLPELELAPGRGQVLITKPIDGLKFKGAFHMEEGYYYFRNVGDRVLFGGGRHLDIKAEETLKHGINAMIETELLRILSEDLLPNTAFEIEQQWSGIMAFGEVKKPILKWLNPSTFLAVRLGGMGMALGSELGEIVCQEVLSS
jgi:glycine/D-amino acid oxidase-like deaminating enzyme